MSSVDILILSNGPGEITTWVLPVVKALREMLSENPSELRISVALSPCPHGTGNEAAIAASYPEVNRVLDSRHFFSFLLWGKTPEKWEWRDQGVVIFLGGDQIFPVIIASRLGYSTLIYAEWEARWQPWVDRFAVRLPSIQEKVAPKYRHKFTVVGDLMAEVQVKNEPETILKKPQIGLLPGSKAAKLAQGLPLCLAVATEIVKAYDADFILPVAPTLTLEELAAFADPESNPVLKLINGVSAKLVYTEEKPYLETPQGLRVKLITQFPANEILAECKLCFTTVGANTAQLTALGVPMVVMLPTQQLEAMRSWDGIGGVLANLPGVGLYFAKIINTLVLKKGRLFAWPNIWAKQEIVPELLGQIEGIDVAREGLLYLENPEKLQKMRDRLLEIRPQPGAAKKMAEIVSQMLSFISTQININ